MRFFPLAVAAAALLAACSAPAPTTTAGGATTGGVFAPPPDGAPSFGPGTTCASTYVLVADNARTNYSLASENFRNEDYCAAYPYLRWLIANDPLFVAGDARDSRNFNRLAGVYEYFASRVDSTNQAMQRAYVDSALATRRAGRQAMDRAGIAYDAFSLDLYEGFTYFQNATLFDDAEERQFAAFSRAFDAKPDSLDDWYRQQLFIGSALRYEDDRAARAAFLTRLASGTQDAGLRQYFTQFATFLTAEPVMVASADAPEAQPDTAVRDLLARVSNNTICGNGETILLATVIQQPERVEALGGNPAQIQSRLLSCPQITAQVDNPRTLLALAIQNYRDGNTGQGNTFFQRAIANAGSNADRANFHYTRYTVTRNTADLTEALRFNPTHGPSLITRASFTADAVGRRTDVRGRAAYWCLADLYRNVAASTTDSRIAAQARSAAASYERAGPTREQYFLSEGWRPGQTITASLGSAGSCTTRVR